MYKKKLCCSYKLEDAFLWKQVENLVFFGGKVMIVPPSKEDLQNIIKAWYPNLEPISEKLIGGLYML